jgi:hypothetical protein
MNLAKVGRRFDFEVVAFGVLVSSKSQLQVQVVT